MGTAMKLVGMGLVRCAGLQALERVMGGAGGASGREMGMDERPRGEEKEGI